MKRYEIFASEGGYRIARALWGDSPIIRQCPWYATKAEAEKELEKIRKEDERRAKALFNW